MPKRYEAIRDSLVKSGKGYDEAQRIAAATYNKTKKPGESKLSSKHSARKTKRG